MFDISIKHRLPFTFILPLFSSRRILWTILPFSCALTFAICKAKALPYNLSEICGLFLLDKKFYIVKII